MEKVKTSTSIIQSAQNMIRTDTWQKKANGHCQTPKKPIFKHRIADRGQTVQFIQEMGSFRAIFLGFRQEIAKISRITDVNLQENSK